MLYYYIGLPSCEKIKPISYGKLVTDNYMIQKHIDFSAFWSH